MRLFKIIAADIIRNPDEWRYEDFCLSRYLMGAPNYGSIKVTFFCNKPYVVLVGKVSMKAGLIDRVRLWRAGKKWLQSQFQGIQTALDASLPLDKWIEKRETEIEAKKRA